MKEEGNLLLFHGQKSYRGQGTWRDSLIRKGNLYIFIRLGSLFMLSGIKLKKYDDGIEIDEFATDLFQKLMRTKIY